MHRAEDRILPALLAPRPVTCDTLCGLIIPEVADSALYVFYITYRHVYLCIGEILPDPHNPGDVLLARKRRKQIATHSIIVYPCTSSVSIFCCCCIYFYSRPNFDRFHGSSAVTIGEKQHINLVTTDRQSSLAYIRIINLSQTPLNRQPF